MWRPTPERRTLLPRVRAGFGRDCAGSLGRTARPYAVDHALAVLRTLALRATTSAARCTARICPRAGRRGGLSGQPARRSAAPGCPCAGGRWRGGRRLRAAGKPGAGALLGSVDGDAHHPGRPCRARRGRADAGDHRGHSHPWAGRRNSHGLRRPCLPTPPNAPPTYVPRRPRRCPPPRPRARPPARLRRLRLPASLPPRTGLWRQHLQRRLHGQLRRLGRGQHRQLQPVLQRRPVPPGGELARVDRPWRARQCSQCRRPYLHGRLHLRQRTAQQRLRAHLPPGGRQQLLLLQHDPRRPLELSEEPRPASSPFW